MDAQPLAQPPPSAPEVQIQPSARPVFDFPPAVRDAKHILIKPNVGYPAQAPVIVRMALLGELIDQLLALRPDSRISIVEGVCTKVAAAQVFEATGLNRLLAAPGRAHRVALFDADRLPLARFDHPATANRFASLQAPELLNQADARISIAPFKVTQLNGAPLVSASIKNLFGLLPRAVYHARSPHARGKLHLPNVHRVIADVYHVLGRRFDFGVVDLHEMFVSADWQPDRGIARAIGRVVSGPNLLAVDLAACAAADQPRCAYLDALHQG